MRNKVTKRQAIEGDLEDYIGCIVSTNLTATMRAKLVAVSTELCLFETSETPYEKIKHYNCAVGQLFTLSSRDVRFMHFPVEENDCLPINKKQKTNGKVPKMVK